MTREEATIQALQGHIEALNETIRKQDKAIKALEQESTTKNDCAEQNGCISCSLDDGDDCCRKLYEESMQELTTKNDLGVDCISREQALEPYKILENTDTLSVYTIRQNLAELPSVTPQEPRWIPVSESLPEPYMFVNATCKSLVDDREDWVVETIYVPIPKEHNPRHYSDWGNIPMLNWGEAEVIAWMERIIPKPYVVEGQTGENTDGSNN